MTQARHDPSERLVGADRVLAVLAELASHPSGITLEEMAKIIASPTSSVHRALASLKRAGFAMQDVRGHYLLGDEFLRMAFEHHEARPDHVRVQSTLEALTALTGETTHYAVLEGRSVVYRSKVDPVAESVRLSSTVGGRNPAHCTAVGKLLLSYALPDDKAVRAWVAEAPLLRRTPKTITSAARFAAELSTIREQGYAVDDQETDDGINCLAIPAFLNSPQVPSGAISVSALAYRSPLSSLIHTVDAIREIAARSSSCF